MKNILFIHSSAEFYGSDKSLYNLVKGLSKEDGKITVMLPCNGILVDKIKSIDEKIDVIVYDFAVLRRKNLNIKGIFKYFIDFVKSILKISKVIKENDIEIVYTNTSVILPGAITAKILGKKSVWHVREVLKDESKIVKILKKVIKSFSNIIITNSIATKNSLGYSNYSNVKVVYNAVNEIKISDKKNTDVIRVGMAGRINRWKGQKLFVDLAEHMLKNEKTNLEFLIAGDAYKGEEYLEEELKKYIENKSIDNNVKMLGRIDDISKFYELIDVFILPSIEPEPFGLVVIEAMSCGIPVIATNHGGPCEIINSGYDGYLADYNNCIEMAGILTELIHNDESRRKIGENAKITYKERFSVDKYVKNIKDILNEL